MRIYRIHMWGGGNLMTFVVNDPNFAMPESHFTCRIKSEDFKYVWSLRHERNSGIRDLNYPENYVDEVKQKMRSNKFKTILVDLDEEEIVYFKSQGVKVSRQNMARCSVLEYLHYNKA